MSKRKQKEITEHQRPLASFGFKGDGRSIAKTNRPTDQPGPSSSTSEQGQTGASSAKPSEKRSDCEQAKHYQEKWTLEFPWLYRGDDGAIQLLPRGRWSNSTLKHPPFIKTVIYFCLSYLSLALRCSYPHFMLEGV